MFLFVYHPFVSPFWEHYNSFVFPLQPKDNQQQKVQINRQHFPTEEEPYTMEMDSEEGWEEGATLFV